MPTCQQRPPAGGQNGFDEFWPNYPNKKKKQRAKTVWKRLGPDSALLSKIMTALAKNMKNDDWNKDDGQYIPHPSTWLNDRRWDDEIPEPQKKRTGVAI